MIRGTDRAGGGGETFSRMRKLSETGGCEAKHRGPPHKRKNPPRLTTKRVIWAHLDLNQGPTDYEHAKSPLWETNCRIKHKTPVVKNRQRGSGDSRKRTWHTSLHSGIKKNIVEYLNLLRLKVEGLAFPTLRPLF